MRRLTTRLTLPTPLMLPTTSPLMLPLGVTATLVLTRGAETSARRGSPPGRATVSPRPPIGGETLRSLLTR